MSRVYDVNSVTGYLFPSCTSSFALVEVTIEFQDCNYRIRQQAYSKDDFQDRVKFIASKSLRRDFTIADPIHTIPNSYFNKVILCKSIVSTISPSDPRADVTKLRSFINEIVSSESVDDHVSFMKSGNNIVLTLGVDYVIKVPTRYSHSLNISRATEQLRDVDYRSYAVLPIWHKSVRIRSEDTITSASVHFPPTYILFIESKQFSWLYAGAYRDCGVYPQSRCRPL